MKTAGCPDDGVSRGRMVRGPWRLGREGWSRALARTAREFLDDHLLQWAAALTFFAVLSLFPALLALVSLLGLAGGSALQPLIENVSELAPGTARNLTLDALQSIQDARTHAGPAFAFALVAALWSASGYVGAFIPAANVVWEVEEARPVASKLLLRIVLTVALLLLVAATALTVVLTGPIAKSAGAVFGLGDQALTAWGYLKWPFLAAVIACLIGLLYWAAPNVRHPSWRWVVPGSLVALALWIAASVGFTAYVNSFGTFDATYGSIGGVIVFLIWLWLTNVAVLLGAELTAELERGGAIAAGLQPPDRTPYLPPRDGGPS